MSEQHGTPAVAAWSTFFGFLALLPWSIWELSGTMPKVTLLNLGIAAYLGLFVTAIGLYLWLFLLRTVPAVVATSVQYRHPIIGIVVGAMMFEDRLGLRFAVGVLLILAGLALVLATGQRGSRR